MGKYSENGKVISQVKLASDVYSIWIETNQIAKEAKAGQFVSIYTKDGAKLLPRPISICEINGREGILRLVYRVVGAGTAEFSGYQAGETVRLLGPLGNGFPSSEKTALLIGGGIGIPPMLQLAASLEGHKNIVLGFRDETFLEEELEQYGNVYIATDDGSKGVKGTVIDAIKEHHVEAEVIYACGPTPMLRAVKAYGVEKGIPTYLSMEERMACGVGACLACVCQTKAVDAHSNVHNKRVCKDGPVFLAEEVEF